MKQEKALKIAIVGMGYWGPKLLRNFKGSKNFTVKYLVDTRQEVLSEFEFSNPEITVTTDIDEALADTSVDCVAIASPPKTHFDIAHKCLAAGKHVLIEKPFTASFEQAKALVGLSEKTGTKIMADFTFLYNGAMECVKNELSKKSLGELLYIDSVRINLGVFQNDVNVAWDLACHDISIFNYLLEELPHSVQAIGIDGLNNGIENIAYIHLKYGNKFAHINCSWSSPVKIRTMLIGGTNRAVLYNDIEPTDKVKVYDKGVVFTNDKEREALLQDYRTGQVIIPKYDTTETLSKVISAFYELIVYGKNTKSDSENALLVMFILEYIQKSIVSGGKEITINWEQVGASLYSYITSKGMLSERFEALTK